MYTRWGIKSRVSGVWVGQCIKNRPEVHGLTENLTGWRRVTIETARQWWRYCRIRRTFFAEIGSQWIGVELFGVTVWAWLSPLADGFHNAATRSRSIASSRSLPRPLLWS